MRTTALRIGLALLAGAGTTGCAGYFVAEGINAAHYIVVKVVGEEEEGEPVRHEQSDR